MRIMTGWTVDLTDVLIGVGLLATLVLCGFLLGVLRQIVEMDVASEECRDECYCANSGQQDANDTCGSCGRYCETGHGE